MIRISTVIWLVLSIVTGAMLLNYSQKSENERHRISVLNHKIADEQQSIAILEAEWSYLNRPARLRKLAEKHLDLDPVKKITVLDETLIGLLDTPPPPAEDLPENTDDSKTIQAAAKLSKGTHTPDVPPVPAFRTARLSAPQTAKNDAYPPVPQAAVIPVAHVRKPSTVKTFEDLLSDIGDN